MIENSNPSWSFRPGDVIESALFFLEALGMSLLSWLVALLPVAPLASLAALFSFCLSLFISLCCFFF
jgi:hypothetical protein